MKSSYDLAVPGLCKLRAGHPMMHRSMRETTCILLDSMSGSARNKGCTGVQRYMLPSSSTESPTSQER